MNTYRHLVYLVLDELKLISDDSFFSEEHIMFLLSKYRGLLLKREYKDIKKEIPESNYQTLCLETEVVDAIPGLPCEGSYLRSKEKIPELMTISSPKVYAADFYQSEITYVPKERMRYVGNNKWLQNVIYASLGPDNYLYLKSSNPQYLYMENLRVSGIFEDPEKVNEYSCDDDTENSSCDPMDNKFPIEEALIPELIQLVVKELSGALYKPADSVNNASDDLSDIYSYIKRNMKSDYQKQLES